VKTPSNTTAVYCLYCRVCNLLHVSACKGHQQALHKHTKIYLPTIYIYIYIYKVKVKCSCYIPGVTHRVGRGIALLFHDRGTRRGLVVSSTPLPHFTPGKNPVPVLQEAGCAPGPVWTCGKSRPHRDSIPDSPARSQSLYRLSYRANIYIVVLLYEAR